jgi:hypothetical protein
MGRPAAHCGLTARTVLHQAHEGADNWGHPLGLRGKPAGRHPQAVQELPNFRVKGSSRVSPMVRGWHTTSSPPALRRHAAINSRISSRPPVCSPASARKSAISFAT